LISAPSWAEADIVEKVVVEREQGPLGAALRRP
jgi:hypothetical protein